MLMQSLLLTPLLRFPPLVGVVHVPAGVAPRPAADAVVVGVLLAHHLLVLGVVQELEALRQVSN